MTDTAASDETRIIETAFEARVRDLFKVFAEAIYTGESERDSAVRFRRGPGFDGYARLDFVEKALGGLTGVAADNESVIGEDQDIRLRGARCCPLDLAGERKAGSGIGNPFPAQSGEPFG